MDKEAEAAIILAQALLDRCMEAEKTKDKDKTLITRCNSGEYEYGTVPSSSSIIC